MVFTVSAQQEDLDALVAEFRNQETLVEGRFFVDEELLYSMSIQRFELGIVEAIATQQGIAFELESYADTFNFPIVFNQSSQNYTGWFIDESKRFSIDLNLSRLNTDPLIVNSADQQITLSTDEYLYKNERLYILHTAYQSIFGITHKLRHDTLDAEASSLLQLPFLKRLARQKGAHLRSSSGEVSFVNLPRYYEILSPQILDFQSNLFYRENDKELRGNYSIQGVRDIAQWSSNISLAGNENNFLNSTRVNFSKKSLAGDVFGNTGITQFEFGDVRDIRQANAVSLNESLGVLFSNAPLIGNFENNLIQIDGDVPIGWDVELYRNNVLLNQAFNVETGRYNFLDVPLLFGNNNFEVILYGPQGQVRRRTLSRLVDESTSSAQKFSYAVSLTDTSRSLISSGIDDFRTDSGYNLSGRMNVLVANNTTADFGVRAQFGGEQDNRQFSGGINTILFNDLLLNSHIELNDNGVNNLGSTLRTRLLGQSLSFVANLNDVGKKLSEGSEFYTFGMDGKVPIFPGVSIPLNQQLSLNKSAGSETLSYSNRAGFRIKRLSVFNSVNYERTTAPFQQSTDRIFGNVSAQFNFDNLFLRAGAIYAPKEIEKISALQANLTWNISKSFNANLNYANDFTIDNQQTTLFLSYLGDNFRLSSRIGHSDLQGFDFGINASFSLSGQNSSLNKISSSAMAQSGSGSLAVRVFLDKNLNAIFDANDIVLENVEVTALQFYRSDTTDKDGIAILNRLPSFRSSDIVINRDTLPDPFLMPRVPGVSITMREGLADNLDYPVVPVSEITGIVDLEKDGTLLPGARLKLILSGIDGRVVAETRSEYDGFYSFVDVMPGTYTISIAKESQQRFNIKPVSESAEVRLIPDVIERDFTVQEYGFDVMYLSEIQTLQNNTMSALVFAGLKNKLRPFDIEVYRYELPKSDIHSFYTRASKQVADIEEACGMLREIDIACEARKVLLRRQ